MRTFHFRDATSHKFWSIEVTGDSFTVTFGKVGTKGQTKTKSFPTPAAAQTAADKLIREKTGKGYVEQMTAATEPVVADPEAEAFELAILENPDDLTVRAAYADWLQERDDPRGEFIQVQLALEDESRPVTERKQLQAREAELLKAHEREWLGELAPLFLDPAEAEYPGHPAHRWRGGFLTSATFPCLTMASAQTLAAAPAATLLRELRVFGEARYYSLDEAGAPPARVATPRGYGDRHWELFELIGSSCLRNLRVFQMGDTDGEPPEDGWSDCHTYAAGIEHVIAGMPRIEELHLLCKSYDMAALFALPNLTHLRVLRAYHLGGDGYRRRPEYPLEVLAANAAFANLTHLLFHPHFAEAVDDEDTDLSYIPLKQVQELVRSRHLKSLTHLQLRLSDMGDEGVRAIVASGILKRLKWLDLRHGCITDEGARLFAACPDTRNLERLDLTRNAVTPDGLNVLRAAKVNAVANKPLTERELEEREYLREGDSE